MPREKKKRGRREQQKQKPLEQQKAEEDVYEFQSPPAKRQKPSDEADFIPIDVDGHDESFHPTVSESPFYGLLDQDEQDYFKRADGMLVLNQFPNVEEQRLFVDSVWKEAAGKELKIACSQSCSRILERLIDSSDSTQLKSLFGNFEGHFLHLVQHRFASHCCETLFLKSVRLSDEGSRRVKKQKMSEEEQEKSTLGALLLQAVDELKGNLGYLLTERFASHTLRVLLVILSGEALDHPALASKRKESYKASRSNADDRVLQKREVPDSFRTAIDSLIQESVSGLDATYLRALATHPTGNPTLQLLLSIELSQHGKSKGKERTSILSKLLPDEEFEEGTASYSFLKGLLYDPVGSHLLEVIVQSAPGRTFRKIYNSLFKDRVAVSVRNDVAGFVALRVLERLGKEDLEEAMTSILLEAPVLVERRKLSVFKTLIERCDTRGIDTIPILEALTRDEVFGRNPQQLVSSMLRLHSDSDPQTPDSVQKQRLGVQLAQSMLHSAEPLSSVILEGLLATPLEQTLSMASSSNTSRLIQEAAKGGNTQFRRKFLQLFSGHLKELALDSRGSHLVDALWPATDGLMYMKERFAQELAANESALRESHFGRAVWKNWAMDLYNVRRDQWIVTAREQSRSLGDENTERSQPASAIDEARVRFAAAQAAQKRHRRGGQRMVSTKGYI